MQTDRSFFLKALGLIQERTKKLSEVSEFLRFFFVEDINISITRSLYSHQKMGTSPETAVDSLLFSQKVIEEISENFWNIETIKETFLQKIKEAEYKNGFILFPLRVALSGEEFSPGTFELLDIFGKERSQKRINNALKQLS